MLEVVFKAEIISGLRNIIGLIAFLAGSFGSLMLFIRRVSSLSLKLYAAPVDYFNLVFLFSIFITGLVSWLTDTSGTLAREYVAMVIFIKDGTLPIISVIPFVLTEVLIIYLPFTKLFHYIAKYFTFHKVLWDDSFKFKGSPEDEKIIKLLSHRHSWEVLI